jgi:hypothetical protein
MARGTTRRGFVLRGLLGGGAVTLGLPLFDCVLDGSGKAMAATLGGGRLPVRFGTWFWGSGVIPHRWAPRQTGADYDLPPQLAGLKDVKQHVSVLSGFDVPLSGEANSPHFSGNIAVRTGSPAEGWQKIAAPSLDVLIADAIGSGSVFRSLNLTPDGNPRTSYSFRNGNAMNASIPSPLEMYQQLFGPDFQDPNSANFTPDPRYMVRRSVLSGVTEERRRLMRRLGAADRARADQYFTSVREVEQKLALQLQKPPPAESCRMPAKPGNAAASTDIATRAAAHKLMSEMLAMALACNQTKVFNMAFSTALSDLRRDGAATGFHQCTHEELTDRTLGYQPTVDGFVTETMNAWGDFVRAMAAVKEGDGTLLDNMLVLAHSDVSFGKNHSVTGLPMMLAGHAGGKIRSGLHISNGGDPVTRVGLTVQQIMGVPADAWGAGDCRVNRPLVELYA